MYEETELMLVGHCLQQTDTQRLFKVAMVTQMDNQLNPQRWALFIVTKQRHFFALSKVPTEISLKVS